MVFGVSNERETVLLYKAYRVPPFVFVFVRIGIGRSEAGHERTIGDLL
jgi:hypothetical protein